MSSHRPPKSILAIDIGGTNLKILATGRANGGGHPQPFHTPTHGSNRYRLADGWEYEALSMATASRPDGPRSKQAISGQVGSASTSRAFGKPVHITMQPCSARLL